MIGLRTRLLSLPLTLLSRSAPTRSKASLSVTSTSLTLPRYLQEPMQLFSTSGEAMSLSTVAQSFRLVALPSLPPMEPPSSPIHTLRARTISSTTTQPSTSTNLQSCHLVRVPSSYTTRVDSLLVATSPTLRLSSIRAPSSRNLDTPTTMCGSQLLTVPVL